MNALEENSARILCMPEWVRNLQGGTSRVTVKTVCDEGLEYALDYHWQAIHEIEAEVDARGL